MPISEQYRKILLRDESTLMALITHIQMDLDILNKALEGHNFNKELAKLPNVQVVYVSKLDPVKTQTEITWQGHSLSMAKMQRCVIVHALNGNKKKAERWLGKFVRATSEIGEAMSDSPMSYLNVNPDDSIDEDTQKNENSYKCWMDERMKTYNTLRQLVESM
jgi:hypothetical protein